MIIKLNGIDLYINDCPIRKAAFSKIQPGGPNILHRVVEVEKKEYQETKYYK